MEVNDDSSSIWFQKFWKTNCEKGGDGSIGQHWQHREDGRVDHGDNTGRSLTENYLILTNHHEGLGAKRKIVIMILYL